MHLGEVQAKNSEHGGPCSDYHNVSAIQISMAEILVLQDGTRRAGCDESSGWVWYAARYMLAVLTTTSRKLDFQGMNILELGSGTGWLGLQLGLIGANVTVTDRQGALPLLRQNVMRNTSRLDMPQINIEVCELDWTSLTTIAGEYDMVVGSDILYLVESHQAFLETAIRHGCRKVMVSWEERRRAEEQAFLSLAAAMAFHVNFMEETVNPVTGNPVYLVSLTMKD